MKNCPKCGASLEEKMNFCPNCHADCRGGAPAQVANIQANNISNASETLPQQATAQPGGTSTTKKIIGGVCSLLVAVGAFFACEYLLPWAGKQAEKEKLCEALKTNYAIFSDLSLEDLAADGDHNFRIFPSENDTQLYFVSDIRICLEGSKIKVIDKGKLNEYATSRELGFGKGVKVEPRD